MPRQILGVFLVFVLLVAAADAWILVKGRTVTKDIATATMNPEMGNATIAPIPHEAYFDVRTDSIANGYASDLRLFEDGRPLGPAHSMHDDVRKRGAGLFSHWGNSLVFSSSDATDPRSNGRKYSVSYVAHVIPGTARAIWLDIVLGFSGLTAIVTGVPFSIFLWRARQSRLAAARAGRAARRAVRLEANAARPQKARRFLFSAPRFARVPKRLALQSPQLARPVLGGLLGLAMLAGMVSVWVKYQGVGVKREVPAASISSETGHAFVAPVPHQPYLVLHSDGMNAATASDLRLFENGSPLGPAHSAHDDIRQRGAGLFSHWGESLVFASSDGTDPRSNGRTYTVAYNAFVIPNTRQAGQLNTTLFGSAAIAIAIAAFLLSVLPDGSHAGTVGGAGGDAPTPEGVGGRRRTAALVPRFAMETLGLTAVYLLVLVVVYASVVAQSSSTGTFKINYEYRVF